MGNTQLGVGNKNEHKLGYPKNMAIFAPVFKR